MRRKSTALTKTIAGAAIAASVALVIPAWAQQAPQTAVSGSVQTAAQPPAGTPSASATNSAPMAPQEQANSTSGTGVSRGARYLVRNGLDYVEYQEYDRALKYLREAEARQAELTPAERTALKQGIENAQRGLREAVGAKTPYAASKKPRKAGGFTVAQSRKQAQAKALAAQAAATAGHNALDDSDSVPEPKGDPIRLASGTSVDNEGVNVVRAADRSSKQAVAIADPAVEVTSAAADALSSGASESSPPAQLPDIDNLPIRTTSQAPVVPAVTESQAQAPAVTATPTFAPVATSAPASAPSKPLASETPVDNENAKAVQANVSSPIPSIDLSGIPEAAAASKAAAQVSASATTQASAPAPTETADLAEPVTVEAPKANDPAEIPTPTEAKVIEVNAPDVAAPVLTATEAVAPVAAVKPQEPSAPATPVTQPVLTPAPTNAKVETQASAPAATPAPIKLETISDPATTSSPVEKVAPTEAPASVATATDSPVSVVTPDPAASVPAAITSEPLAPAAPTLTPDPAASVPAATSSAPVAPPDAALSPNPAASVLPATTSEPVNSAKDAAKSDSAATPAAATSTDDDLPPLPNDISLKADTSEPSVPETKLATAPDERATPVPLPVPTPASDSKGSDLPDGEQLPQLPPLPPEAEAAPAKPSESTSESALAPTSETKAQEPAAEPAPAAPVTSPVPVGDPVAEQSPASSAETTAQPGEPAPGEPVSTTSPAAESSTPTPSSSPSPAHVEVMPLSSGGGLATGLGIPQRANPTSRLSDDMKREVEQIARQQEEMARRRQIQPSLPGGGPQAGAASGSDLGPIAGRDGGSDYGTQSQVDISRAPSPAEARPIHAIPVPDDYVPLAPRDWSPQRKYWSAAGTCHMPLYFQDAALERYGHSVEQFLGPAGRFFTYPLDDPTQSTQRNQLLQPVFSVGLFAAQIVALPYNLIMDPPWEAEYDLGYYRPGDQIPTDVYYLPLHGVGPPLKGKSY